MSLYAYCLSDEVTARTIESIRGVAGATPMLIEHEGLAAVVSDYEDKSVSVTRENVLAHERVVQQVLAQTTPLPFRFGTLVSEARLRSYLATQKSALCTQLARVRGCVEMSVKVIRGAETFESESTGQDSTMREEQQVAADLSDGAGTIYLHKKRREMMGDELLKERAEEIAGWLAERLASTVRESVVSVRPKEMLIVAAAYLVEVARLEEYRERLRRARDERREIHFLTSGPWPPYSFSNISS
jgi:hypothetical protein